MSDTTTEPTVERKITTEVSGDALAFLLDLPPGTVIDGVMRIPPDDPADALIWKLTMRVTGQAVALLPPDTDKVMLRYETQDGAAAVLVAFDPVPAKG